MKKIRFSAAVNSQPDSLRHSLLMQAPVLEGMKRQWLPGQTVGVVAMGASSHSGHALLAALGQIGIRGVNITASDVDLLPEGFEPADHYVVVSESGLSPEPISAAGKLASGNRIGLTNVPDAPIAEAVDQVLPLGGFDDSPVYTIGYSATLLAYSGLLQAMAAANMGAKGFFDRYRIPDLVAKVLADYADLSVKAAEHLDGVLNVDFVGRGYSLASASEGALIFREALQLHTAAFDTYQYLHGPMEPLRASSGLVIFGDARELSLADSVLDAGVKVVLITTSGENIARPEHPNLLVIELPEEATDFARAIVEIVIVQLVVSTFAENHGLTIQGFRYHQDDTKLQASNTNV